MDKKDSNKIEKNVESLIEDAQFRSWATGRENNDVYKCDANKRDQKNRNIAKVIVKALCFDEEKISSKEIENGYQKLKKVLEKKIERKKKTQRALQISRRVAAILIFAMLFLTGVISYKYYNLDKKQFVEYSTPAGQIGIVKLDDGTNIWLNSESSIKYAQTSRGSTRDIYLVGEAWFDVASNKQKAFVVHTAWYNINVSGTKFNVKAYENDSEICTTLEEGKVIISSGDKVKLKHKITLNPGQQISFNKKRRISEIRTVNTKYYSAWKEHKVVFIKMKLIDLVSLLERRYGVEIEITEKTILDLDFDGTLTNETIFEVMELLRQTLPISYRIKGQKIMISKL